MYMVGQDLWYTSLPNVLKVHNQVLEVLASAVENKCQSKVPDPLIQGTLFVKKGERAKQKFARKVVPMVSSHSD